MESQNRKRFPKARRSAFEPSADPNYRREFYILNPQDHAPLKDLVEVFMPSSLFIGPNLVYNQAICAILGGSLPAAVQGEPYPVRPRDFLLWLSHSQGPCGRQAWEVLVRMQKLVAEPKTDESNPSPPDASPKRKHIGKTDAARRYIEQECCLNDDDQLDVDDPDDLQKVRARIRRAIEGGKVRTSIDGRKVEIESLDAWFLAVRNRLLEAEKKRD